LLKKEESKRMISEQFLHRMATAQWAEAVTDEVRNSLVMPTYGCRHWISVFQIRSSLIL